MSSKAIIVFSNGKAFSDPKVAKWYKEKGTDAFTPKVEESNAILDDENIIARFSMDEIKDMKQNLIEFSEKYPFECSKICKQIISKEIAADLE